MRFNKRQKAIIRKIASGEIKDIPSYIKAFNLSTFYSLNKEEIEKRMKILENGKKYKKYRSGFKSTIVTTTHNNPLNIPMPCIHTVIPTEEDFEHVPASISYSESTKVIKVNDTIQFEFDYFQGINVTNSFSEIKDFLTIWQFLKSEGLILEVEKEVTKEDYETFFEFKPIFETEYGKEIDIYSNNKTHQNNNAKKNNINTLLASFGMLTEDSGQIKDYRNYVHNCFEYNKANELICSQFISKQIYGNAELDLFIKKGYKTIEETNTIKALIPAYLALLLTLGIALWQNLFTDNSDILNIQNQLTEIQRLLNNNPSPNLTTIEKSMQEMVESSNIESINKLLEDILAELNSINQSINNDSQ